MTHVKRKDTKRVKKRQENLDEKIKRIEDDNLEYTLHKYQNYPTEFIKENRKSSLLLDMGLDKTVIGVMAIKDLFLY